MIPTYDDANILARAAQARLTSTRTARNFSNVLPILTEMFTPLLDILREAGKGDEAHERAMIFGAMVLGAWAESRVPGLLASVALASGVPAVITDETYRILAAMEGALEDLHDDPASPEQIGEVSTELQRVLKALGFSSKDLV